MSETRIKRALFAFAHPDDETLGAGGLIARLMAQGVECWFVWATSGGRTLPGNHVNRALRELGLEHGMPWSFLGLGDQSLTTADIPAIADSILERGQDRDLVVTHLDSDINHDHGIMRRAVEVAFRPFANRGGPHPMLILGAEIPTVSDQPCHSMRTRMSAVSSMAPEYGDAKMQALGAYGENRRALAMVALDILRAETLLPGPTGKPCAAEAFEVIYMDLNRLAL